MLYCSLQVQLSFVVEQGIESVCSKCPMLHKNLSALKCKYESLQQQKSQLEIEKNMLETEKKILMAEHESMKRALEFEIAQPRHQKNSELEYVTNTIHLQIQTIKTFLITTPSGFCAGKDIPRNFYQEGQSLY